MKAGSRLGRTVLLAFLVLGGPRLFAHCAGKYFPDAIPTWLAPLVFGSAPIQSSALHFEQFVHDFGTVLEGDEIVHQFRYQNRGESDVRIVKARKSCGCAKTDYPRQAIPPGAEGEVHFVFETKNKTGRQTKKITLETDEAEDSQAVLLLRGSVHSPVIVRLPTPGRSITQKSLPGESAEHVVELTLSSDVKDLSATWTGGDYLTLELSHVGPSQRSLTLRTQAPATPGVVRGEVQIQCQLDGSQQEEEWSKSILVQVNVPEAIRVAARPKLRGGKATALLKNQWPEQLSITRVESSCPEIEVQAGDHSAKLVRLSLSLEEGMSLPSGAHLVIHTDHPEIPTVEIPIEQSP